MKKYTKEQIVRILEKHSLWLVDADDGERANLRYADLRSADLRYADLRYADLRYADLRYADLRYADLRYASLSSANLRYANLRYADLRYAVGNMAEIKNLLLDTWPVVYTSEYLHIGCERHAITDWWRFDDSRIASMDKNALVWWKKYGQLIRQTIELSPATTTYVYPDNAGGI